MKQEKFILSRFWKPEVKNRSVGSRAVWGSRGRKHLAPHSQHPVAPGNPGCVWAMAAPSLQILPLPTRPASHPLSLFFLSTFPPHLLQWETNGQFMEVMGSQRHLKTLRPAPAARSSLCSRRTCPGGSRAVKPAARGVGLRGRREVVGVKPIARPGPGSTKEGRGARGQSYNF